MELRETLSALRAARGLSQTELAEKLEVSRQSVSKWETGASVPDLDKLVRLSEFYGVTLDELVRGQAAPEPAPTPTAPEVRPRRATPVVLACTGALLLLLCLLMWRDLRNGLFYGLMTGLPFLVSSLIVLNCSRHPALWSLWTFHFGIGLFLYVHTAVSWRLTLYTIGFPASENYTRLAIAWGILLVRLALVALTVHLTGREGAAPARRTLALLAAAALVLPVLPISVDFLNRHMITGRVLLFVTRDWLSWFCGALLLAGLRRLKRKQM